MLMSPLVAAGVSRRCRSRVTNWPINVRRCRKTDASPSCNTQRSRPSSSNRAGAAQSDTLSESAQCKMCIESRGHDSPHREQSNIDALVPQFEFDYGYVGGGGPLQIACFLVGADTSHGAIHSTMVPDSKKMDMPMPLRQQPSG